MKSKFLLFTALLAAKVLTMSIPQVEDAAEISVLDDRSSSTCSSLYSSGKCSADCPCQKAGECCSKYGYCGTSSSYCSNTLTTTKKSTTTTKKSTTTTKKSTTTTKKSTTTTKASTSTSSSSSTGIAGVVAYLPNYKLNNVIDINKFDFSGINVVNYCFFRLNESGEAYSYYESIDFTKKNIYYLNNDVKKKYPNLRTVLSFGGGSGSKNFASVLSSDEKIKVAAKSIANTMKNNGFDGVDIDWEFPSTDTERAHLYTLLKKIRYYIGDSKILTISASATASKYNGYAKKYSEYVNWFNIMTYNYAGSWSKYTGYNAPLYSPSGTDLNRQKSCDVSVKAYNDEGIPSSKLVIGGAFSGQAWKVESSSNNGFNQQGTTNTNGEPGYTNGMWSYKALREQNVLSGPKAATSPWVRTWHSDVKSPTLFNAKTMQYISYDDGDAMCERAAYVKKNKLAGVLMWEIGQDYKRELLDTIIYCYKKY